MNAQAGVAALQLVDAGGDAGSRGRAMGAALKPRIAAHLAAWRGALEGPAGGDVDAYIAAMLRETDFPKQRALMREFEKHVLDTEAHEIFVLCRYRMVPYRSYMKGWKISPSQYLATLWLDK